MRFLALIFFAICTHAFTCFVGSYSPSAFVPHTVLSFDSVANSSRYSSVLLTRTHWQYGKDFAEAVAVYQQLKKQTCDIVVVAEEFSHTSYLIEQAQRASISPFLNMNIVVMKKNLSQNNTDDSIPGTEGAVDHFMMEQAIALANNVWDGKSKFNFKKRVGEPFHPSVKVSVVIVTHDRPDFLLQAIESVKMQTYQNIEVIVVDDGSASPQSKRVLDSLQLEFETKGWKIVKQENLYLGAARNRGVKEATGELVLFLDDDNIALPNMVESLARAVKSAEIAVSGHVVWKHGESTKVFDAEKVWLPVGPVPFGGVRGRSFVGSANFLVTKKKFLQLGGFNEERSSWEDFEFHSRAVHEGATYAVVPEPLMLYRMHSSDQMSLVGDNSKNAARIARLYKTDSIFSPRAVTCTLGNFRVPPSVRGSGVVVGNFQVLCDGNTEPSYVSLWTAQVNVFEGVTQISGVTTTRLRSVQTGTRANFLYQFSLACTPTSTTYRAELVFSGTDAPTSAVQGGSFQAGCRPRTNK